MMVIELVEGDENKVKWNYGDGWHYADIDDLVRAYESVRHGHWVSTTTEHSKCSNCGVETYMMDGLMHDYCSECGAKMDDIEEEKHGHWIRLWDEYRCSNCNDTSIVAFKECPNCGAKMDEVEDG